MSNKKMSGLVIYTAAGLVGAFLNGLVYTTIVTHFVWQKLLADSLVSFAITGGLVYILTKELTDEKGVSRSAIEVGFTGAISVVICSFGWFIDNHYTISIEWVIRVITYSVIAFVVGVFYYILMCWVSRILNNHRRGE